MKAGFVTVEAELGQSAGEPAQGVEDELIIIPRQEWQQRASRHHERVMAVISDVLRRRQRGEKHPVEDFLFDYYNLRPGELTHWYPGVGYALADADEYAGRKFFLVEDGVARVDVDRFHAKRGSTLDFVVQFLSSVASRKASFHCFGMHEWAMVYGLQPDETRHPYLGLRVSPEQVIETVEQIGVRCTHFDAFRFFTDPARPLNQYQPTRDTQIKFDQPGCLHANMDLYKWAGKLIPILSADLVFDCFALARDIRALDMQASAYDVADWGYPPVEVETVEGRQEYVRQQRQFAERAHTLRHRILHKCKVVQELVAKSVS